VTGAISTAGGLTRFGSSDVKLRRIEADGQGRSRRSTSKDIRKASTRTTGRPNDVITIPRRLF